MKAMNLKELGGKVVAVSLRVSDRAVRLLGEAACESDPDLGEVLRISLSEGDGAYSLLIRSDDLQHPPVPADDADYLLELGRALPIAVT
jgi:hypothetical protein